MTSNSLSIKSGNTGRKGSFIMYTLRSYWWIAVICSVVYGFAGPVFTMLKLDSISGANDPLSASEFFLETQMSQMVRWFCIEGFMPLYFSAVVLAAVIGCVMFFYLQQKKQVNFYHSQPITRTRLFWNQYIVGLVLNIVPLVIMTAVSFMIVAFYGFGSIIRIGVIVHHLLQMVLMLLASYSIAAFAGQLTGMMATHMLLNAVLHFAVPVGAWIVSMMCSLFFATYTGTSMIEDSLKFSPFCAVFQYLDHASYGNNGSVMTVEPLSGSTIAVQIGMILLLSGLSWLLYQKRPSEAAGKAMVYSFSEPVLKAYLMFIVGITAGMVFQAVGSKMFFYFAVISFAILTHMTCEVIIQNDFKAMGKRFSHCAVILVLILGIVGVFRFDLLGYDSYLPEPDEVQQVSLIVPGAENMNMSERGDTYSQDTEVKQAVYNLLQPIVSENLYRSSDFNGNRSLYDYGNKETTSVTVQYRLKNGDVKSRIYRAIAAEDIEKNYETLYNLRSYREAVYADALCAAPEDVYRMNINDTLLYDRERDMEYREVAEAVVVSKGEIVVTTEAKQTAAQSSLQNAYSYSDMADVLEAYKQDVRDRSFDALKTSRQYNMELQLPRPDNAYYYLYVPVYESDIRTMAVLEKLNIKEDDHRNYSDALIFRCEEKTEAELRTMLDTAYNVLAETSQTDKENLTVERCKEILAYEAELTGHITGTDNVDRFINECDLLNSGGIFVDYDQTHFVLLRYNHTGSNDWQTQLFYNGTVPAAYQ